MALFLDNKPQLGGLTGSLHISQECGFICWTCGHCDILCLTTRLFTNTGSVYRGCGCALPADTLSRIAFTPLRLGKKQEARFNAVQRECSEAHASMQFDKDNLKEEVGELRAARKDTDVKIDNLENRSRRDNIDNL